MSFSINLRGRETYLFLHPLANLPCFFFQPVIVKCQAAGPKIEKIWILCTHMWSLLFEVTAPAQLFSSAEGEQGGKSRSLSLPRAQIPSNYKLDVFLRAIFILYFQLYSVDSLQQIIALLKYEHENKL